MPHAWTLALAGLLAAPGDVPRTSRVAVAWVDLLDEPDDAAFSTGRLALGREVTIRRDGPGGWATLDPPPGSFSLIDAADVEERENRTARVTARYAAVRPGRDGARMPGPPRVTLRQGAVVRLLDRRPLVVRQGGTSRTWLPIEPPRAEVRFVRSDALEDGPEPEAEASERPRRDRLASDREERPPPPDRPTRSAPPALEPIPIDDRFASAEPDEPDSGVSPGAAAAIGKVASQHREILRRPLDRWDLTSVEQAYRGLLQGASGADRRAVEARLAKVERQKAVASAARRMEEAITRSRARDGQVREDRRKVAAALPPPDDDYDASGLFQRTSRLVDGRRVYALLGDDGGIVCYLAIPPGIPIREMVSRRVGVRGEGRYDEALRARLILVRDLEPLSGRP